MSSELRTLKAWQVILLVAVLVGAAWGIYGIYDWASSPSVAATGDDNTQLVAVQRGDLTNSIYASGSLTYSTSERLTFDSAGTVEDVFVEKDDTVSQGEVIARLDSTSIEFLEEAVARARINLRDAEEALEDVRNPYGESDIEDAGQAVARARQELVDAQQRGEIQIANAEYAVDRASDSYSEATVQYVNGAISFEDFEQAGRNRDMAKLDLVMARVNADRAVSEAENRLETAEETLEDTLAGADPLVVALKQSEVDGATAALDDALEQLELARAGYPIVAPFDGVVARVNVDPGDDVNANTVVIELVDPSTFEVSAMVDEIDVSELAIGQAAVVTLDALPDLELAGEVSSISAFADVRSGVVSYAIALSVNVPSGIQPLEGMSATATIDVHLATNVLLLPNQAISGTFNSPTVIVIVDDQQEAKAVTLGATDGSWTEVVAGLGEGDMVAVQTSTGSAADGFIQGAMQEMLRRGIGPGMGGGAFPGRR